MRILERTPSRKNKGGGGRERERERERFLLNTSIVTIFGTIGELTATLEERNEIRSGQMGSPSQPLTSEV